jgi:hypothetical protein
MTNEPQNTPNDEPKTEFNRVWDDFMEHGRRGFEESGKAIDALFPPGFKEHSAVARDEFRKGLKTLVDYTIDELEKLTKSDAPSATTTEGDDDDNQPPSTTGKTKVKVQVE